jgi:hypothetical protein
MAVFDRLLARVDVHVVLICRRYPADKVLKVVLDVDICRFISHASKLLFSSLLHLLVIPLRIEVVLSSAVEVLPIPEPFGR